MHRGNQCCGIDHAWHISHSRPIRGCKSAIMVSVVLPLVMPDLKFLKASVWALDWRTYCLLKVQEKYGMFRSLENVRIVLTFRPPQYEISQTRSSSQFFGESSECEQSFERKISAWVTYDWHVDATWGEEYFHRIVRSCISTTRKVISNCVCNYALWIKCRTVN